MNRSAEKRATICILAAGKGTRMGSENEWTNKALLPLGNEAVLSRIFSLFPKNSRFVIALGHASQVVTDFLALAHADRDIEVVQVQPFSGPGSGPGASLAACEDVIGKEPFFLVCADTLWSDDRVPQDRHRDWIGTSPVSGDESPSYLTLTLNGDRATSLVDKTRREGDSPAFIGLAHILSVERFFDGLRRASAGAQGERQLAAGFTALLDAPQGLQARAVSGWLDVGTEAKYAQAYAAECPYNTRKSDEITLRAADKLIKLSRDPNSARLRFERMELLAGVVPDRGELRGHAFAYKLAPGDSFYAHCTAARFREFLSWAETRLWTPAEAAREESRSLGLAFYKAKTLQRIELLHARDAEAEQVRALNGEELPSIRPLLEAVDWDWCASIRPVRFHGDLQFDNIIYDPEKAHFRLVDWRTDFAGETRYGDWYYDLAKLHAGIGIDFRAIRLHGIPYTQLDANSATSCPPSPSEADGCFDVLREFCESKNFDYSKVECLSALIYINMAALHQAPFQRLLYTFGKRQLAAWLARHALLRKDSPLRFASG